jgi:hypothetical protein
MAAVSGHSFNIGPMGKLFKSLLWNQSANLKQTWHGWSLGNILSKLCPVTTTSIQYGCHEQTVLTYIVKPYGIWIIKIRCIRHADILKRAYLCQVSDTGSPEPLVLIGQKDATLWTFNPFFLESSPKQTKINNTKINYRLNGLSMCRSPFILLWGSLIQNLPYM